MAKRTADEPAEGARPKRSVLRRLIQVAAVGLIGVGTGIGVAAVIRIPSVESIDNFTPGLTTVVRDSHGTAYRTWATERRELISETEIPAVMRDAVLAAEDKNFYQHGGVDLGAIIRSSVVDIKTGELATGASTLTMQLARTYFQLTREARWSRKIKEALLSVELEKRLSKDQILALYLNVMNFGGQPARYGVKAATRYYFDKDVADLSVTEAAMLTAILPSPSRLSPYRTPERVLTRRNWTLDRMLRGGSLTPEVHAAAIASPLGVVKRKSRASGPGPFFAEEVRRHLEARYGEQTYKERGLRVDTTIDLDAQRAAERAVRDGLSELDRRRGWRDATRVVEGDPATEELSS
ncbi:MAG: transglycosylase domain-containing protein, partial [Acidobacteriota bacterium]|nr:transglycosylase domain-containing protein [Acidobacteriota bacterium]